MIQRHTHMKWSCFKTFCVRLSSQFWISTCSDWKRAMSRYVSRCGVLVDIQYLFILTSCTSIVMNTIMWILDWQTMLWKSPEHVAGSNITVKSKHFKLKILTSLSNTIRGLIQHSDPQISTFLLHIKLLNQTCCFRRKRASFVCGSLPTQMGVEKRQSNWTKTITSTSPGLNQGCKNKSSCPVPVGL